MNATECQPGTIVMFADDRIGVVDHAIEVPGSDLPAVLLLSGTCAYCEDLVPAPRFLIRNEHRCGASWSQVRPARGTELTVAIISFGATPEGRQFYWTTDRKVGWCELFSEARQAVEQACGIGGRDGE